MSVYERCFEAEILHEVLYGIDAKCMKLGSLEADQLGSEAVDLANSIFSPEYLTDEGLKSVNMKLEELNARYDDLIR